MAQYKENSHIFNLNSLVLDPFTQPLLRPRSSSTWEQRNGSTRVDPVLPMPLRLLPLNHPQHLPGTTNPPSIPSSLRSMRLHFHPIQSPSLIVINPRIPHHTLERNGSLRPSIHPFGIPIPISIRLSHLEGTLMHPPGTLSPPPAGRSMAIFVSVIRQTRRGPVTPMSNHLQTPTANWD